MSPISRLPSVPGHPFIAYQGDALQVEGVPLSRLAQAHGTPLFVYSKAAMLDALGAYQRGFAGRHAQICYAMKANSSLGVLQVFAQAGCGFDGLGVVVQHLAAQQFLHLLVIYRVLGRDLVHLGHMVFG